MLPALQKLFVWLFHGMVFCVILSLSHPPPPHACVCRREYCRGLLPTLNKTFYSRYLSRPFIYVFFSFFHLRAKMESSFYVSLHDVHTEICVLSRSRAVKRLTFATAFTLTTEI